MRKLLPKTSKNPQGFTLVELLVVVAIIAVLSVIGITIFGNVQRGARDAKRKADIEAIANVMEANYNATATSNCAAVACTGTYCALADCHFAAGKVPVDPINSGIACSGNSCRYCVRPAIGACPAVDAANNPTVAVGQPPAGTAYIVCTSLETNSGTGGTNYECRRNQQ